MAALPSIRTKITALVLACAVPAALGYGVLVQHFYQRERDRSIADAQHTARALAAALDRELDNGATAALALATSPSLQSGDLAAFQRQASALLRPQFPGAAIVLSDASGQQLVHTDVAFGQALPRRAALAHVRQVVSSGKPSLSNLHLGSQSQQYRVSYDVPVWRNGVVAYDLAVTFSPERLGALLLEQRLPPDLLLAILDGNGVVVARSHLPERFVGHRARPDLLAKLSTQDQGVVSIRSLEGIPVYASFSRAPHSGWSIALSMPKAALRDEVLASVSLISAAVAALLLAGVALAWAMGGRIRRSVQALAVPPEVLAGDAPLALPPMAFREAAQVAAALERLRGAVRHERQAREALLSERSAALDRSNDQLASVYATAPVGLCVFDADLRYLAVNECLAEIDGVAAARHLGRTPSELLGEVGKQAEQALRQVLASGQALLDVPLAGALPAAPQEARQWSVNFYPVREAGSAGVSGVNVVLIDVTQRKRLEARLRDNEEYFRVLYESSRDAQVMVTLHAGYIDANPAAVALFGCAGLAQLLALSPASASPEFQPDGSRSAERAAEVMQVALETGFNSFEWLHQRADGSTFHADVLLNSVNIGGSGVLQATLRDITERKQTEQAFRDSKLLLRSIIDTMPALIVLKRASDLRVELLNREGEQLLGLSRQEVLGKTDYDLFPAEEAEYLRNADLEVLHTGKMWEAPQQALLTARHGMRYLATRKVLMRDEAGAATHVLSLSIDVTQSRRAEDALRLTTAQLEQSEHFIRTITDNLPGMVAYWDAGQRCRFANRRYLEGHAMAAAHMQGRTIAEVLGAAAYAASAARIEAVLAGQPQAFAQYRADDDRHDWVDYIPDRDPAGRVRGFFVMIADISVLKRAELRLHFLNDELVHERDRAEAASSAKSEFVANMSHEIRTPMNAIIGLARLLEEAPLERRERSYVAKIKLATQALLGVLNDVLDFSRIEAGQLTLEQAPFKLEAVLASTAVLVASNAWAKGVEPIFEVAPEVPRELVGDPMRLQQVLLNLVGNAIKFTEHGEVLLSIGRADADADADAGAALPEGALRLQFRVCDTGIGIAPALQEHMFDAFSQGDNSTSRRYGGSGLGLAICRRLVDLMGGSIGVHSVPGAGATFHFSAVFGASAAPATNPDADAAADAPPGLRLLIVDDNHSVRRVLAEAGAAFGWHCDSAPDGATALAMLAPPDSASGADPAAAAPRYDLLLLDSAMPGQDGIATLMQARAGASAAHPLPPVIMLVASDASEQLLHVADGLSLAAILGKPATPTQLLAAVLAARRGTTAAPAVALPTPLSGRLAGMRVLLVEDNEINQEVAQYILLHAGARVAIAANGQLAVDRLAAGEQYDAVLMDIQMPVMNGYTATETIRAMGLDRSTLPIIAMTANAMADDRQRASSAGTSAHISKPIEVDELIDTLTRLVHPAAAAATATVPPPAAQGSAAVSGTTAPALDLPALPGIDMHGALQRFAGNYPAYVALLKRFENSQGDAVSDTRRLLAAGQRQAAGQALHRLRGVAANLGAGALATLCEQAGAALAQADEIELARLLVALERGMAQVIAGVRTLPLPAAAALAPAGAPRDLAAALAQLLALLQNNNLKALTHFQDMRAALEDQRHGVRETALALAEAVETLSFGAAEKLVIELLKQRF